MRGWYTVETLPRKFGPIIVSIHHLPHLPVVVALTGEEENGGGMRGEGGKEEEITRMGERGEEEGGRRKEGEGRREEEGGR